MPVLLSLLLALRTLAHSRAALQFEILALRHQLAVLQRTRPRRVPLAKTDRWLWVMLSRLWAGWPTALVIVKPTGLSAVVDLEESVPPRAPDGARRCPHADS